VGVARGDEIDEIEEILIPSMLSLLMIRKRVSRKQGKILVVHVFCYVCASSHFAQSGFVFSWLESIH
jgi:hypothetical protein